MTFDILGDTMLKSIYAVSPPRGWAQTPDPIFGTNVYVRSSTRATSALEPYRELVEDQTSHLLRLKEAAVCIHGGMLGGKIELDIRQG
jgi:hypothetical protein